MEKLSASASSAEKIKIPEKRDGRIKLEVYYIDKEEGYRKKADSEKLL